jgi:uncharacterized protein DUF4136
MLALARLSQWAPALNMTDRTLGVLAVKWLRYLMLLTVAACGSAATFQVEHETSGTLAGRPTYAFTDVTALGEQGFTTGHLFNPIMQRRIRDELTQELSERGYKAGPAESATMLVTFSAGSRQDVVTQGNQTGTVVRGPAYTIDRGALVLHFLDPSSKAVIWRGWGAGVIDADDDLDKKVREAVREIMASFPASKS